MDREETVRNVQSEMESLVRLHKQGLYYTRGYQARKREIERCIREYQIDLMKEIDPVSVVLYRRYCE